MKTKSKILTSLLLSICLVFSSIIIVSSEAIPEIIVENFTIEDDGSFEVYGYIKGAPNQGVDGHQVTFLLSTVEPSKITTTLANQQIAYIDQRGTSNNAEFYFTGKIRSGFLDKKIYLNMKSDADTELFTQVREINPDNFSLNTIEKNSVIYGVDVYKLTSNYLTAKYVADSFVEGGNKIYYKLGRHWYDLLNKDATDSSYLVPENAVDYETVMLKLPLRHYYCNNEILDFKK